MKLKRVGLNALFLKPGRVGGTEIYTRQIAYHLADAYPDTEWHLIAGQGVNYAEWQSLPNLTVHTVPIAPSFRGLRLLVEQTILPMLAATERLDAMLNLGGTCSILVPCPQVTMLHDLQFRFYPEHFTGMERVALDVTARVSISRSRLLLAPSEKVKRDVVGIYRVDPERIQVVPHGIGPEFHPPDQGMDVEQAILKMTLGITRPYFLSVAAARPHKGLDVLLDVYWGSRWHKDYDLLMAGAPGPSLGDIQRHPAVTAGRARWLGWVPDDLVPLLYRYAAASIITSRFEGFGIPVIEAMASGCPLIASDISPLREIAGQAALYFTPDDISHLGSTLDRLLDDRRTRQSLYSHGIKASENYRWGRTAAITNLVLERVVS